MKQSILAGVLSTALIAVPALLHAQASSTSQASRPSPTKVTIDNGVLVGEVQDGVRTFRGVPYAKPPVGELRWRPPHKTENWPSERAAVAFESPCAQPTSANGTPNGGGVAGSTSEDCLYLNVYAPENARNAPVVVWVHGGAYYLGAGSSGSYSGTSNAKEGVITVSINYRLGSFGTFAHPSLSAEAGAAGTAGFGLMDSVAALEWVKRNVAAFGGDPNNVTLAGQSAGAFMVIEMLSLPSAKGLYHKAVLQSGTVMVVPPSTLAEAEQRGVAAVTALGLPGDTMSDLRGVSAQTLMSNPATQSGFSTPDPVWGLHTGAPIDGRFKTISTLDALAAGAEFDVPVLLGTNSGETGPSWDGTFGNARTLARTMGGRGAGAWLYHFTYVPEFRKNEWKSGPIHSAEMMFTFDSIDTSSWSQNATGKASDADRAYAKKVNSCWIAFYKMDPSAKSMTCADGVNWPAHTATGDDVMKFGNTLEIVKSKSIPD